MLILRVWSLLKSIVFITAKHMYEKKEILLQKLQSEVSEDIILSSRDTVNRFITDNSTQDNKI